MPFYQGLLRPLGILPDIPLRSMVPCCFKLLHRMNFSLCLSYPSHLPPASRMTTPRIYIYSYLYESRVQKDELIILLCSWVVKSSFILQYSPQYRGFTSMWPNCTTLQSRGPHPISVLGHTTVKNYFRVYLCVFLSPLDNQLLESRCYLETDSV